VKHIQYFFLFTFFSDYLINIKREKVSGICQDWYCGLYYNRLR